MLGIVGDPIDPRGLAHASFSQYENVDVLLLFMDLQIGVKKTKTKKTNRLIAEQYLLTLARVYCV